jgi:hypothetical protein
VPFNPLLPVHCQRGITIWGVIISRAPLFTPISFSLKKYVCTNVFHLYVCVRIDKMNKTNKNAIIESIDDPIKM